MSKSFGWIPPSARMPAVRREVDRILNATPTLHVVGAKSSAGAVVKLYDYAKRVNGGKHLPCRNQEVGDCVSQGGANAVDYLACMEIVRLGDNESFRSTFAPYLYGVSRVQIGGGRLGRSDGSIGAWLAEGVQRFGVLPADADGCPSYSGTVAKRWGVQGPPEWALRLGVDHLVKSAALVTTYEKARDALANGYPVTVASSQGFKMRGVVDNGKLWGVPEGTWMHQMVFIAIDDTGRRPGCYCLNSWKADAHGPPADDAPPGGFWVDARIVNKMVAQGDSFAFSQFDGFPARELDWSLVG